MTIAVIVLTINNGYGASGSKSAYIIFTNGTIYINSGSAVTNLVVSGGAVAAYNVDPGSYPGASFVNLNGGVAYPGFHDSHDHLMEVGCVPPTAVNLSGCNNAAEIATNVAKHAQFVPAGKPVIGVDFSLAKLSNAWTLADRDLLNQAGGGHEVMLMDNLGHNCIVNSAVMTNYNITATSTVPLSGVIVAENGQATGLLKEAAMLLCVQDILSKMSDRDVFAETLLWLKVWASFGYTSINDMMGLPGGRVMRPQLYAEMESQGVLPLRVNYALTIEPISKVRF